MMLREDALYIIGITISLVMMGVCIMIMVFGFAENIEKGEIMKEKIEGLTINHDLPDYNCAVCEKHISGKVANMTVRAPNDADWPDLIFCGHCLYKFHEKIIQLMKEEK